VIEHFGVIEYPCYWQMAILLANFPVNTSQVSPMANGQQLSANGQQLNNDKGTTNHGVILALFWRYSGVIESRQNRNRNLHPWFMNWLIFAC
jgi:hypothetical protein